MSSKHRRATGPNEGRGRLVLLPGGLDDRHAPADDHGWRSFCGQIGWQSSPPLASHDEQRLIERVLASAGAGAGAGLPLAGEPGERRAAEAHWAPPRRPARDPFVASTAMAAAAAVFLFLAAIFSWAQQRSAASAPVPARDVTRPAPTEDRAAPVRSPDAAPPQERTPAPAPSEKVAPVDGHEPGALVARARSARRPVAPSFAAPRAGRPAHEREAPVARAEERSREAIAAPVAFEPAAAPVEQLTLTPIALATAEASWREPRPSVAMMQHAASRGVRHGGASWAISPASDRWYGVSLPPAGEPERFPTGVGVVAQVDLGKAFGQL